MKTDFLRVNGNYSTFLEAKEEYLHAQGKRQESLENRVHTEIEWLRRGPKASTTKSKARIDKAHEMIGELADLNARTRTATAKIDFRVQPQTKRLIGTGRRHLRVSAAHFFQEYRFYSDVGHARWPGRAERQRQDDAASSAARRESILPRVGKFRQADSLRIVYFRSESRSSIRTGQFAARWLRTAIR
jgi:ABC transport system ATP-binding/permease protein